MIEGIESHIPEIVSVPYIVVREQAFVSLNSASADVRIETIYRLQRIGDPPQITSSCDQART